MRTNPSTPISAAIPKIPSATPRDIPAVPKIAVSQNEPECLQFTEDSPESLQPKKLSSNSKPLNKIAKAAKIVAGKRINQHTHRPLQTQKRLPAFSGKPSDPEETEIRMIGGAPFVRWASQPGVEITRLDARRLASYTDHYTKSSDTTDFEALNKIPESDIKTFMTQKLDDVSSLESRLPARFHPFIKDYQAKLQISAITEEDFDISMKGKEPLSMEDIKKKLPKEYHDFVDVFLPQEADELPPHRPFDHKIELKPGTEPPYQRGRPMSPRELDVVKKYLDEHLTKGFIRPSTSSAAAPVLLAKKPGGGIRVCVDYRGLNAVTAKNRYPIPLIRETLDLLCHAKYYTKLDVIAAFNRLRITEGDEWKTAFLTRYGLYEYLVMPFGLQNAPAAFQHFVNSVLHKFLDKFASAYLDDIIIYSKSKKEHRGHVRQVLEALQKAGLQLDIRKCDFGVQEIKYLGLIITTNGIKMDPKKVETIVNWNDPPNVKDLQSFLGFANFYRRFIKDFSKIAHPLTTLTRKDQEYKFDDLCKTAFQKLKEAFTMAPVLAYFVHGRKTVVETDASNWASGGVLSQYDENGVLHPVAYFSGKHTPQECNYEIYDKELLAIIKTLEEWRPELEGTEEQFDVITDHKNLQHFMTTKLLNQRQIRWSEFLSRFNFRIVYRPGVQGGKPDALTRRASDIPNTKDTSDERISQRMQTVLKEHNLSPGMSLYALDSELPLDSLITQVYESNADAQEMVEAIRSDQKHWPKHLKNKLKFSLAECKLIGNRIYFRDRLFIPDDEELKLQILLNIHSSAPAGHPGKHKTTDLLRRSYFWPRLNLDAARFVRNCYLCSRSKSSRSRSQGFLKPLEIPFRSWTDISVDYVTGLPDCTRNGVTYRHVLVVVDRLTKMRHFIACETLDVPELTQRFMSVYCLHGAPLSIVSDRGSQFVSTFWKQFSKRLGIKLKHSSAFHPQTDGQTEIANAFMEQYLRGFVNFLQDDWLDWLPLAEFACNNHVSETTGISPFFANYGYHPRLGVEPSHPCPPTLSTTARAEHFNANSIADRFQKIHEFLRQEIALAQDRQEAYANASRSPAPAYREGDKVWLDTRNIKTERPSKKLDDKFKGPFKVVKAGSHSCTLDLPSSWKISKTFHTSLLRPAAQDPFPGQEQINTEQKKNDALVVVDEKTGEEHLEWEFKKILDSKIDRRNGRLYYKIQWTRHKPTWQPSEDVEGCDSDIKEFHQLFPNKPGPPGWFKG
jgi:hypothetical protein